MTPTPLTDDELGLVQKFLDQVQDRHGRACVLTRRLLSEVRARRAADVVQRLPQAALNEQIRIAQRVLDSAREQLDALAKRTGVTLIDDRASPAAERDEKGAGT